MGLSNAQGALTSRRLRGGCCLVRSFCAHVLHRSAFVMVPERIGSPDGQGARACSGSARDARCTFRRARSSRSIEAGPREPDRTSNLTAAGAPVACRLHDARGPLGRRSRAARTPLRRGLPSFGSGFARSAETVGGIYSLPGTSRPHLPGFNVTWRSMEQNNLEYSWPEFQHPGLANPYQRHTSA